MSTSRHRWYPWSNSIFLVPAIVPVSRQRNGKTVLYLVTPEDTTESAKRRPLRTARFESRRLLGVVKAVFWITVSVTISLLIGQLH